MALVWADPFDQYGTGSGNNPFIQSAGYTSSYFDSWGVGRTGPRAVYSYGQLFRRPLDTPVAVLGQGAGLKVSTASNWYGGHGLHFESAGNTRELHAVAMTDNSIGIYDRTDTLKGQSAPNVIAPNTWYWLEVEAIGNTAGINTGSVECRVNGVTVLIINGLNLPNLFAVHGIGNYNLPSIGYFDDYIVWNTLGAYNNSFIGDRRLYISYPNANAALQDFVPTTAPAYGCVDSSPPNDAAYISGAAVGNISEFAKGAIGIASNDIAALVVIGRIFKSDAGAGSATLGINSAGHVLNSPDLNPDVAGRLYQFMIERDPNGNIPWTRAAADAANIRITRTA